MEVIIEKLPELIIYIIMGYCFIRTYHFVALKQNSENIEHILTTSFVIGFIYCKSIYILPLDVSPITLYISMFILSILLGYILGRIVNSTFFISFLDFFKIRDTPNKYLWDDLMDKDYPMKVSVKYEEKIYEGMLHYIENYTNKPNIVLASYLTKNVNTYEILEDYTITKNKVIILDTSTAECIEIIYDNNSQICKDLCNLCEQNKKRFIKSHTTVNKAKRKTK